jgi:hypothetical protein
VVRPVDLRHPVLITGVLAAFPTAGILGGTLLHAIAVGVLLITLSFHATTDVTYNYAWDELTYTALVISAACALLSGDASPALIGFVAGGVALGIPYFLWRGQKVAYADVAMLALIGMTTGLWGICIAFLVGLLFAVYDLFIRGKTMKTAVPYAVSFCCSAFCTCILVPLFRGDLWPLAL